MSQYPTNDFKRYHAHVYFDENTVGIARELCMGAWQACRIGLGRFHEKPVGPHPDFSCQLTFDAAEFDQLIPWLDAHRDGLNILIHPLTGDALAEHTTHARWLGEARPLKVEIFSKD